MRKDLKRGSSNLDAILIIVFLAFLWVAFIIPTRSLGPVGGEGLFSPVASNRSAGSMPGLPDASSGPASAHASYISLGGGNARYAYQPYEEYITITNRGREPIDITGWQLRNGKDQRGYELGGTLRRFPADTAVIPRGALFISPAGSSSLGNIVLGGGETAIVTTGFMGSRMPYVITSFKENICSRYLGHMPEYSFSPQLTGSCPAPRNEPGLENLDTECRRFVESLSSCRAPEFETRNREGEICRNCVNGVPLSSSCRAFIKERFSYQGCIAHHRDDPSFSNRTWRVFLGQGWEMWARDYESIKLFDSSGNLVTELKY